MKHGPMKQLQGKRQFKPGKVGRERERKKKEANCIFLKTRKQIIMSKKFFFFKKRLKITPYKMDWWGDQCTFKISK